MSYSITILGIAGRMGQALVRAVGEREEARLVAGTDRTSGPALHPVTGVRLGFDVSDDAEAALTAAEVALDFTTPTASLAHARLAVETATPLVLGTTGFGADEQAEVAALAGEVAILQAANFSFGVNLLLALTRQAAAILGPDWDIEIAETHHRHKVDAPSGTALALGDAAADGRGVGLETVRDPVRDGIGAPRAPGAIGFAVLRGGDVAGEHSVQFLGMQERLELTHRATDRMIFARGAVAAALWLADKPPHPDGRPYGMADMLGLSG